VNSTGEHWKDVLIALSTAAPSLGGEPPKLYPLKLDFIENAPRSIVPPSPARLKRRLSIALRSDDAEGGGAVLDDYMPLSARKKPVTEDVTSKVQSQGTSATFHIERKATIDSDKKPHKVTVAKSSVDTSMEYVVVPAKSEHAFLKAKARNSSEYQLLEGDMNVFMDGLFITTSKLQRTNPGEEFQLYLGVDPAVRVEVKPPTKQEDTSGLLKKTFSKTTRFTTVIRNNKRQQVKVLVYDPIPFSSDKSISIKLKEPADPAEYTINEESIMKRVLIIPPGEERRLKLGYVVEASSDKLYYVPQTGGDVNY